MIAWSSAVPPIRPIERIFSSPGPHRCSIGSILWSLPSIWPSTPSMRGRLNPQMSASSTPTVRPRRARLTARLAVTDDLPTPPLPDATARILRGAGDVGDDAAVPGLPAGPGHEGGLLLGDHLAHLHLDGADPGNGAHPPLHVGPELLLQTGSRPR